ncbi:ribosome small subunit-dependent GTPase A [Paraferrimonas sp. SM1919]|uniref:ribosome small subunit-dependent GTPase A n=1 Tax=Paraferrimonas sp. SM1919 TaxID=2662263 RepID=UPI0013D10332|nr:ribosome small subunit-dependent GTPase A [Paraferrimonas sp. SM1919]
MSEQVRLLDLGWKPFYQQQLSLDEYTDYDCVRVIEQHKGRVTVQGEVGIFSIELKIHFEPVCVGDWVLIDAHQQLYRVLDRQSLFSRKAPGSKIAEQLIAANIDTAFIVCSLNDDFNLNRIERYLVLVKDAEVEPVVILTKADLCSEAQVDDYLEQVQQLDPFMMVHAINTLDNDDVEVLYDYCSVGRTLVFLGSSGVGKSTLVNSLLGSTEQKTAAIREGDSKGRHTTTARALKLISAGGLLMDTPGMRELQLADTEQGVKDTFSDITELSYRCRFGDCRHQNEPGCAVIAAIVKGSLEQRRLISYQKLIKEQELNSSTIAEKRARDKAFGKMIGVSQQASRRFKHNRD